MLLLTDGKNSEQDEPCQRHGVPVPRSDIDSNLTEFDAAELVHQGQAHDESQDAENKVGCVDSCNDIKKVACRRGPVVKGKSLGGKLPPRDPLPGNKETTQGECPQDPWQSSAEGGIAESEPFFEHIDFTKDVLPRDLHREAAEEQDCRIEIENRRKENRAPVADLLVRAWIHVGAGLAGKEERHQNGEEHHVTRKAREEKEADAIEEFARTTVIVLPVVIAPASATASGTAV
jgi:hypothetical protein